MSAATAAPRLPLPRPGADEHAEFLLTYVNDATAAMSRAGIDDVRDLLPIQMGQLDTILSSLREEDTEHGYAPGKWTIKESLVHMADVERVFAYRMMRTARGDRTPLPSFEHNDYVPESRANVRELGDIVNELRAVRGASIALVGSLDDTGLAHRGTAGGNPITPRALVWVIAGHTEHHLGLFRDRYLPALQR